MCEGCKKSVATMTAIMMIFCALWRMNVSNLMTGAGSGTPIFLKRESRRQLSMVGVIIIFLSFFECSRFVFVNKIIAYFILFVNSSLTQNLKTSKI